MRIWEYQLNNLEQELVDMVERFFDEAMGKDFPADRIPIFRVLPVKEKISKDKGSAINNFAELAPRFRSDLLDPKLSR